MATCTRTPAGLPPYWELVTLIASITVLNAAAIDIVIPALQEIGAALDVADENRRQVVITAHVRGFGAAQIVCRPLAGRFGRKPVVYVGLGI